MRSAYEPFGGGFDGAAAEFTVAGFGEAVLEEAVEAPSFETDLDTEGFELGAVPDLVTDGFPET